MDEYSEHDGLDKPLWLLTIVWSSIYRVINGVLVNELYMNAHINYDDVSCFDI